MTTYHAYRSPRGHVRPVATKTLVRVIALAVGLVGYLRVYDIARPPTRGDADIGRGLLAFGLIVVTCLIWGVLDGLRDRAVVWLPVWAATAIGTGLALDLVIAIGDGHVEDVGVGVDPFTTALVSAPAVAGAGFSWLVTRV